jgi:hypothetical protein
MKRTILAGLTILTLAVVAASPASALSSRFRDAHRTHNDVTGRAFAPALTTEANLNPRFKEARDANRNNKLNPRFKEARDANLNNKLNPRFKEARNANRNNKLNPRFKVARDRNIYN